MKERSPKNSARPISRSRWLAYAAAVSATAFGTAAAEAEIHYSGVVDKKLVNPHGGTSARFRLSNGAYISLYNVSYGRRGYNYAGFRIRGSAVSHGFRASVGPPYFGVGASRLHSGELVSQGIFRATYPSSTVGNIRSFYGGGNWDAGGRGFIGFKFNTGAGTQYGWARIKISPANFVKMIVVDYAWGDPGDTIKTGQTGSETNESTAIPASGSLGLLALGGAGLMAWRNRRDGNPSRR